MAGGMVARALAAVVALGTAGCTAVGGSPTVTAPPGGGAGTPARPAAPVPAALVPPPTPAPTRVVADTAWAPFATVAGMTLTHPSARVERVAFHEANHDGARQLDALPSAVAPVTLEGRERGTSPRSAADVVVDPGREIRSPVTGTVKRGGTYTLYCEHRDDFVVIAPDANPAWEVKLLHINGLSVRRGQRVVAGETVVAAGPTQLPFESQVDELRTSDPAWPHVHIEVVDPSIPDRPNPGGSNCN